MARIPCETPNSVMRKKPAKKIKLSSKSPKPELKAKASAVVKLLRKEFPDIHCALEHENPFQLLLSTIMSAQCTDKMVNRVTEPLYKKAKTPRDILRLGLPGLEEEIRSIGLYKNKARNILSTCKDLIEKHGGEVPRNMEDLTALAGVGRKTANVVLGNAFGVPSLVVDTHVTRITKRLGLTKNSDPKKIEMDMTALLPKSDWTDFAHLIISHGRKTCKAQNPDCAHCGLTAYCEFVRKGKTS